MDSLAFSLKTPGEGGQKRKSSSEGNISKLLKLERDEKFLISDIPEADFERCLIKLELEEDDPSSCSTDDPNQLDPNPWTSSETPSSSRSELARSMSEALAVLIRPNRESRDPLEIDDDEEEIFGVPGPSASCSPVSTPDKIPPPPSNPSSSATPTPANWNTDAPDEESSFSFAESPGLKIKLERNTPENYFSLIFTDDLFQLLVRATNEFALILLTEERAARPRSRISYWKEATVDEMKKFLGLVFLSGIIKISRWSDFWSRDKLFRIPIFRNTMGRDRFLAILAALKFSRNPDPDHSPPTGLSPIRELLPLLEYFHDNIKNVHEAGEILCIGESMAPKCGRVKFRQHMSGESLKYGVKYGVKLYMLTEPDGLVHRFIIYAGAEDRQEAGRGLAGRVVHKLLSDFEGSGRSLFLDNFYNSDDLTRELLSRNIRVTGSLRASRKHNSVDISKKGGTTQRWSDENINVAVSNDRRDVLTISSELSDDLVTISNWRGPECIKLEGDLQPNESMAGIGGCDQLLADYIEPRKSLNWYKKLGLHIMEIMLLNSYILFHRYSGDDRTSLYDFRKSVIKFLVGPQPQPQPSPCLSGGMQDWYINPVHFPRTRECSSTAKNTTRKMSKRCRQCSKNGINKKVVTYCPGCVDHPGLCLSCFVPWHCVEKEFKDISLH